MLGDWVDIVSPPGIKVGPAEVRRGELAETPFPGRRECGFRSK